MAAAPRSFQLGNTNNYAAETSEGKMKMKLTPAEFKWLALLHNRPSMENMEAMNQWMDSVLKLSSDEPVGGPPLTSRFSSPTHLYKLRLHLFKTILFYVGDCTEKDAHNFYSL